MEHILDYVVRSWKELLGRSSGPMKIRLVLQPLIVTVFAVRAGLRDARAGRPPYFWSIFTAGRRRWNLIREGWGDAGRFFVAAVSLDLVYQLVALHAVRPVQALIVVATIGILPYLLFRGLVNRILGGSPRWRASREKHGLRL
jgi:hypothetical protein